MSNKNFEMLINVPGVPEEVFSEVTDRIQAAVKSILEEYGASGIQCQKNVKKNT